MNKYAQIYLDEFCKKAQPFSDIATGVGAGAVGGAAIGGLGLLLSRLINKLKKNEPEVSAENQAPRPIYGTKEDEDYVKNMTPEERGNELVRRLNETFGDGNWRIPQE